VQLLTLHTVNINALTGIMHPMHSTVVINFIELL